MAMRDAAGRHDNLLRELNEERAAALMRISRTLDGLIARLHDARGRMPLLAEHERADAIREYNALREDAKKYRWYLEVQRESIGFRRHDGLDQFYRIPDPL
jgi:hypothetical protein